MTAGLWAAVVVDYDKVGSSFAVPASAHTEKSVALRVLANYARSRWDEVSGEDVYLDSDNEYRCSLRAATGSEWDDAAAPETPPEDDGDACLAFHATNQNVELHLGLFPLDPEGEGWNPLNWDSGVVTGLPSEVPVNVWAVYLTIGPNPEDSNTYLFSNRDIAIHTLAAWIRELARRNFRDGEIGESEAALYAAASDTEVVASFRGDQCDILFSMVKVSVNSDAPLNTQQRNRLPIPVSDD